MKLYNQHKGRSNIATKNNALRRLMWVDEVRIGRNILWHRRWHLQLRTQESVRKFLSKRRDIFSSCSHDQYYEIHRII